MACSHHGNSRHSLRWGGKHHREKERDSSSILGYFRRQGDTWSEALQAYFAAREEVGEGLFLIVPTSCANFFFLSYSKFGNSSPFFQACLHPHPPSAIWWHMDVTIIAFGSLRPWLPPPLPSPQPEEHGTKRQPSEGRGTRLLWRERDGPLLTHLLPFEAG